MADDDNPSFQTTREPVASNTELQWGGSDGKSWNDAIDTSTGITVSDSGSVQTGTGIPDSVVARWRFNEGGGSTVTDSVGDNNGTINGATYTTDSKEGSHALNFNNDDEVSTDSNIVDSNSAFTVAAWVKTSESNGDSSVSSVVTNRDGSGDEYRGFIAEYDRNDGSVQFRIHDNTDSILSGSSITDGTYHHIAWVYDPEEPAREIWIDGSLDVSDAPSFGDTSSANVWYIGSQVGQNYVTGKLDDVMVADARWGKSEVNDAMSR